MIKRILIIFCILAIIGAIVLVCFVFPIPKRETTPEEVAKLANIGYLPEGSRIIDYSTEPNEDRHSDAEAPYTYKITVSIPTESLDGYIQYLTVGENPKLVDNTSLIVNEDMDIPEELGDVSYKDIVFVGVSYSMYNSADEEMPNFTFVYFAVHNGETTMFIRR